MRTLLHAFILAACGSAAAQPTAAPAAAADIGFKSVAEALAALQARDGNGTVVTQSDGWIIVVEPLASAQWQFPPKDHAAHPAVVRRVIQRPPGGRAVVQMSSLCEAPAAACESLLAEFGAQNERLTQSMRARGREGSTPR